MHRNGAFHCQIKQLEETSAIASKVKLQDLHWKLKRAFCANVLLIKPKAHLQILLKINHNMTNSSWHHSNKFNEQKPLHARIIKFFDGKVFFCFFFLFSALYSTPLLGINQQKKKNVPAKFCRHQIPIYIPTKSNNSENSSLNFVQNLFFMMFWCDFFLFLLCFGLIISFHIMFWGDHFFSYNVLM